MYNVEYLALKAAELNSISSKEYGLSLTQGFYINKVTRNSGADKAG
jgi:S1-C subfamily serine protease